MTTVATKPAIDRINDALTTLVLEHPFYGSVALHLRLVEDGKCATAYTDGTHFGYNPAFIDSLDDQEVLYLTAHEPTHCIAGHPWRRGERDPEIWNLACDHVINLMLNEHGVGRMPKCGVADPRFKGMSEEQVYDILVKESGGKGKGKGNKPGGPGSGNGKGALDEIRDASNPQQAEADWKVKAAQAVKMAKMMGSVPAGIEEMVGALLKPKLPWRELTRRFVQSVKADDYTWRLPRRRYIGQDIYLPSLHSESVPLMVVVIDISGSTAEHQEQFGGEMKSIVEEVLPEKTIVIYCGCAVQKVVEFERGELVMESFKGSGGTSFKPPFEYLEKNGIEPACLIYLTDLEGDFPAPPPYPVLWVSTKDHVAPFGETIQLDD